MKMLLEKSEAIEIFIIPWLLSNDLNGLSCIVLRLLRS